MKYVNLPSGPFRKWVFFKSEEIEQAAAGDLASLKLMPPTPREVDVDSLCQLLYQFSPRYTRTGDGILGCIHFNTRAPAGIDLNEALGELDSATNEHRRRSTLAHEIGHGQLHAGLFTELMQAKKAGHGTEQVRDPAAAGDAFLCREQDVRDGESAGFSGPSTWHRMAEWQANRYMAAVLAPARLVRLAVTELLDNPPEYVRIELDPMHRDELAPQVAKTFNISRQLAAIRLDELFPVSRGEVDLFAR
jgi:hypothetical protein